MDLQQFLSRPSGSFSGAFKSRHYNQDLPDEVRELAHRGLKLFPVSLAAKLAGDPNRLIAVATDDVTLLAGVVGIRAAAVVGLPPRPGAVRSVRPGSRRSVGQSIACRSRP